MVLSENANKPAFAAVLAAIPGVICIVAGPALPIFIGLVWTTACIAFAVWWVRRQLRRTKPYAVVYPAGFVLYDGSRFTVWRWADVAFLNIQDVDLRTFVLFIPTNRLLTRWYRVRDRDGGEYEFLSTMGPRAAQFGRLVEKETFALMMPVAVAQLQAGGAVEFHPFQLKATGLIYQGHFTPWSELGPVSLKAGNFHVDGVGPTRSPAALFLEKIDNPHVFLTLLEQKFGVRMG
jgi:hypothetical protein